MSDLGEFKGNSRIEYVSSIIADQVQRHGGAYVVGPAGPGFGPTPKTAEENKAAGLVGIYRTGEASDAVDA